MVSKTHSDAWLKRKDSRNIKAPRGKHWCYMHPNKDDTVGAYLPKSDFSTNKAKIHGLSNRCKECERVYRKQYEEKFGKNQDRTKTVRVTNLTHKAIRDAARRTGAAGYQYVGSAVRFYLLYGCQYPGCVSPKSKFGRCDKHMVTV